MEEKDFLVVVAIVLGFTASSILFSELVLFVSRRLQRRRFLKGELTESFNANLLRNGIRILHPVSDLLLKIKPLSLWISKHVLFANSLGIATSPVAILSLLLFSGIGCLLIGFVLANSIFAGLSIYVCLILIIETFEKKKQEQVREDIRSSLPEVVQTMKTCFFAGYSLPQVLEQITAESNKSLKEPFQDAVDVLNTGGTFSEALSCIKKKANEQELVFLVTALEIQHKTGSSIEGILEATRESIQNEIDLKRTLRTQTAQAKLSAQIVTILPFALIALFSLVSEGFLMPFFESIAGVLLLILALSMQVTGILLVRKLLRIEVV